METKKHHANLPESTTTDTFLYVTKVEIEKLPTKTTYYVNEEFSLEGIVDIKA